MKKTRHQKLTSNKITTHINQHYALLAIIAGSALLLFATGPFYNWDTTIEFQAARGVLEWGRPCHRVDTIINQPPIGFYIDALFFKCFGLGGTQQTATIITTLFGLGNIFLLYKLGEAWYGKKTGLLAAGLFALTPWQVVLSRSFLIDGQCLFFSLLYLLVGVWAIRKDSMRLVMVAGFFFGVALLTKAFAGFMLIPLGLYYAHHHKEKLHTPAVFAFFVPSALFVALWYQFLSGLNDIKKFVLHEDFFTFNDAYFPSLFFVGNYLYATLGGFFLAAVAISLLLACTKRQVLAEIFGFDVICIATVAAIITINTLLAVGFNLKVPYVSPFKYDFQLLPFICLLAASLTPKCSALAGSLKTKRRHDKLIVAAACLGLVGLSIAVCTNMATITSISNMAYLKFRVEGEVGYSVGNLAQTSPANSWIYVQYVGFLLVILGLLWASKDQIKAVNNKSNSLTRFF